VVEEFHLELRDGSMLKASLAGRFTERERKGKVREEKAMGVE
jgi:hypothetical protein